MLSESMNIAPMTSNYTLPNTVSTSLENFREGSFCVAQSSTRKTQVKPIMTSKHQEVLGV
jgi:hypothetical protein